MKALNELRTMALNQSFSNIKHREDWKDSIDINEMVNKTFTHVVQYGDMLMFANENEIYLFFHYQDCCENVEIEDVCGDLEDLEGVPLLKAECVINDEDDGELAPKYKYDDSYTWTFYKFATSKGYVDVRWYGSSNGYYSEGVSLYHFPVENDHLVREEPEVTRPKIDPSHPMFSAFYKMDVDIQVGDVTIHIPDSDDIDPLTIK